MCARGMSPADPGCTLSLRRELVKKAWLVNPGHGWLGPREEGWGIPGIDGVGDSGAPEQRLQVPPQALPQHLPGALALAAIAHHKFVQVRGAPQYRLHCQNGSSVVPGTVGESRLGSLLGSKLPDSVPWSLPSEALKAHPSET